MQVKKVKSEGLSVELKVTVPASDIEAQIDERLKELGKTVKISGFRPGKVPMAMLKQRYGQSVRGEALEKAVNQSSAKAMADEKIRPAMQPKIEITKFEDDNTLEYTLQVEQIPEFEPADFKKITVEKPVAKVEKKSIEEALERIAEGHKSTETIKEKRATKKGDTILMSFDGSVDGERKPGMQSDEHELELGSNAFIPGFEEQLIGKKAGEKVDVTVTFPEEYHAKDLAGKEAIFACEIKELRKSSPAKLDDELAKKVGMEDFAKLEEAIEGKIKEEYEKFSKARVKRALLDALDEANRFDVPKGMVEIEFKQIWDQHLGDIKQRGLDVEKAEKDKETKDEFQTIAERRVRLGLLLSELGQKNQIQILPEELNRAVMQQAYSYPGQEQEVIKYFQSNPQALDAIRAPLYEDKVVDFILEQVKVKEVTVSVDDLTADIDEEKETERKKKAAPKKSTASKKAGDAAAKKKAPAKKKAAKK